MTASSPSTAGDALDEAIASGVVAVQKTTMPVEPGQPTEYLLPESHESLAILRLSNDSHVPAMFYKDMMGWNRKALCIRVAAGASDSQADAVELLAALSLVRREAARGRNCCSAQVSPRVIHVPRFQPGLYWATGWKPVVCSMRTDWDNVADWYDQLVGEAGQRVPPRSGPPGRPSAARHSNPGEQVLDIACGQGVLCCILHECGAVVTGVDAAQGLIDSAPQRGPKAITYLTGDARQLSFLPPDRFSAATCRAGHPEYPSDPGGL